MDGSQCSAAIAFLWPSSNGCMHSTAPAAMAEPAAQSQQPAVDTDAPSFAALPNNFARDLSLPAAQSRPHPGPACLHARPGAVVPVSAASSAPPTSPFFVGQQTILHSASYPLLPIISTARPCGDSSPSSSASSSPTVSNNRPNALYKTELCKNWRATGMCRYGSKCQFAHGYEELRPMQRHPKYKTELCDKYINGHCPYGERCRFIHPGEGDILPQQQQLPPLGSPARAHSGPPALGPGALLNGQPHSTVYDGIGSLEVTLPYPATAASAWAPSAQAAALWAAMGQAGRAGQALMMHAGQEWVAMQLQLMHFATGGGAGSGLSGVALAALAKLLHAVQLEPNEALAAQAMPLQGFVQSQWACGSPGNAMEASVPPNYLPATAMALSPDQVQDFSLFTAPPAGTHAAAAANGAAAAVGGGAAAGAVPNDDWIFIGPRALADPGPA